MAPSVQPRDSRHSLPSASLSGALQSGSDAGGSRSKRRRSGRLDDNAAAQPPQEVAPPPGYVTYEFKLPGLDPFTVRPLGGLSG